MKLQNLGYILTGVLLAAVVACAPLESDIQTESPQAESPSASSPESTQSESAQSESKQPDQAASDANSSPADAQSYSSQQSAPETKTAQVSVEGEVSEIELRLFASESSPFITYFPDQDFTVEPNGTGTGEGDRFYFSPTGTPNPDAYIQIVFPSASSMEQLKELIVGNKGLLASNSWGVVNQSSSSTYPWAVEEIVYEQNDEVETYTGVVYMGEQNGEVFYAVTHYPAEYGDGFEPKATLILENLEVR